MTVDAGRIRRLNVAAVVGVPLSLAAGGFELARGLQGNELSWVYAVEWPLVAVYLVVIWRRLVREEREDTWAPRRATGAASPHDTVRSGDADTGHDDPGLRAWQDYLTQLHASHPPGGPPSSGSPPKPPAR